MRHWTRTLAILPLLAPFAFAYACGGGNENTNPVTPPPTGTPTTAASDMASAAASAASAAPTTTEAPKPPEPAYSLPILAVKLTPDKAAKIKAIEIKDDGTVNVGGKATYKIVKDELQDTGGKAVLKVSKDGTVTQGDGKPFGKFDDKDSLNVEGGDVIAIGDDGALKVTEGGKPSKTTAGKLDKADAKARREVALVLGIERMLSALTAPPPKK